MGEDEPYWDVGDQNQIKMKRTKINPYEHESVNWFTAGNRDTIWRDSLCPEHKEYAPRMAGTISELEIMKLKEQLNESLKPEVTNQLPVAQLALTCNNAETTQTLAYDRLMFTRPMEEMHLQGQVPDTDPMPIANHTATSNPEFYDWNTVRKVRGSLAKTLRVQAEKDGRLKDNMSVSTVEADRITSYNVCYTKLLREAFYRVQELLRKKIMLWHVDPSKPFYLFVDASDKASGSVLMQYKGRDLRPIAFHSQVFNAAQRRYCASERELLGVMHALKKYRTILFKGADVHVFTDHKSILALMVAKGDSTARLERWRDDLQNYNLKWHHIRITSYNVCYTKLLRTLGSRAGP